MADPDWVTLGEVFLGEVFPGEQDEMAIGVTTTPSMIAAGVEVLRERLGDIPQPELVVEDIYFAMRQAMGEGKFLRQVGPPRSNEP